MHFKRFLRIGVPLWILLAYLTMRLELPWTIILLFSLLLFVILLVGITQVQKNFFIKGIHQISSPDAPVVALTFDDGPHANYTPQVLQLLAKYEMKATFFCIGKNVEAHPELAQQIINEGHSLGNHSYTHSPWIDWNFAADWKKEIDTTDQILQSITGLPTHLFRPPYGVTTPHLAHALLPSRQLIGWTVRSFDTTKQPAQRIVHRIQKKLRPGHILLLHDTHERIIPILEQLLPYIQQKGWKSIALTRNIQHD
jgi:peptidoglycan/xylan/chitin deacetylase (PgdA/CDA1 family)